MKEIILKVLEDVSTNRQLNMQAEGAREMIADKLEEKLQPHVNQLIEEIVVGISKEYKRLKENDPI
tara:strand:- start:173 stop:370 length:198 start_codon:yes stop_codon:yes gene_type:complete